MFNRMSAGAGGCYTFTMKPNIANQLRDEAVTQALQTIERRVNELGVAEPIVARQGEQDQILVQLPGVSDVQRAKDIISSTALLELKFVEQGPFPSRELALPAVQQRLPREFGSCPARVEGAAAAVAGRDVLRRAPAAGGDRPRPAQRRADARRDTTCRR